MENAKRIRIYDIVAVGLVAALVFVGSQISFMIPTIVGETRIHFGNVFCLFAGLLLGGWKGGLGAGIGSVLYDFTNPIYIASAPFTFVFKFFIGFIVGKIAYSKENNGDKIWLNTLGATLASVTYMILYLGKSFLESIWFKQVEVGTALIDVGQKLITSGINAVIAILISIPLAMAIRAPLKKTNFYKSLLKTKKNS